MRKLLTQKVAEKAQIMPEPYEIRDTAIIGYLLRVQPSGAKLWQLMQNRKPIPLGRMPVMTEAMARAKATRILRGEEDQPDERKPLTFEDYLNKHYAPFAPTNYTHPDDELARLRRFEMGDKLLADKWLADVETWRIGRQQDDVSASTINRDTATLHSAFQKAVDWELIDVNPLARLKPLKTDKRKIVRYLTPGEEKRLMAALAARDDLKRQERESANQWRAERGHELFPALGTYTDNLTPLVIVALNTGLRRGELWNLTWGAVDLRRKSLTVHGKGAKSKQTRHIPLNAAAVAALKTHRGDVRPLPLVPVFGRAEFRKAWTGVLKDAGIKSFRFHDCRHSFASKLVMAGVALNTVRELMGHASLEMTLVYAHLSPDNLRAAVELL